MADDEAPAELRALVDRATAAVRAGFRLFNNLDFDGQNGLTEQGFKASYLVALAAIVPADVRIISEARIDAGFVDLLLVKDAHVLVIELKYLRAAFFEGAEWAGGDAPTVRCAKNRRMNATLVGKDLDAIGTENYQNPKTRVYEPARNIVDGGVAQARDYAEIIALRGAREHAGGDLVIDEGAAVDALVIVGAGSTVHYALVA
jgi:hypothetical protein